MIEIGFRKVISFFEKSVFKKHSTRFSQYNAMRQSPLILKKVRMYGGARSYGSCQYSQVNKDCSTDGVNFRLTSFGNDWK